MKALADLASALHVVRRTEKKSIKASPFTVSFVIIILKSYEFLNSKCIHKPILKLLL